MDMEDFWPCCAHDAFVTISEYDCGALSGYLIHPRLGYPRPIRSVSHLIRLLDQAQRLDTTPYLPTNCQGVILDNPNKIASFTVSVLFRQNHTLQGRLVWHETSMETVFRSALELVYLMDDILASKTNEKRSACT